MLTERQHMLQIKKAFEAAGHKFEIMYDSGKVKYNGQKYDAILALKDRQGFCFIEAKIGKATLTDAQLEFQIDCFNKDIPCYVLRIGPVFFIEKIICGKLNVCDMTLDMDYLPEKFEQLCRFREAA